MVMTLTIEEVIRATGADVLQKGRTAFDSYGIDSRKMRAGGLFFALKGEQTDGHLFVQDAFQHGAAGAVVEKEIETGASAETVFRVRDSLYAMQKLATFVRTQSNAKFVGITGSSGKTSTKEFAGALLKQRYGVFKSEGNLNSLTGLPLSLLSMYEADCAVFEIAMNRPGEIQALASLLQPHVGVLLNVNAVHLGQFPSIEAIADEKCAMVSGMNPDATLIYNEDDSRIVTRVSGKFRSFLSFGFLETASLRIQNLTLRGVRGSAASLRWNDQEVFFETHLCGIGNLYNIAGAAAIAISLGCSAGHIAAGIPLLQPYPQRGILFEANHITIYDDSYNSNPRALELALDLVASSKGFRRKIAVVGDMLELGSGQEAFHAQAGEQIASRHFDALIATGPLSRFMAEAARKLGVPTVLLAPNSEEAARIAIQLAQAGDLFLVKGSRGIKMERVVEKLREL